MILQSPKTEQTFEAIATIRRIAAYGRDGDARLLGGLHLDLTEQGRELLLTNVGQAAIITWSQAFARTIDYLENFLRLKGSRFVRPGSEITDATASASDTALGAIVKRLNALGAASRSETVGSLAEML